MCTRFNFFAVSMVTKISREDQIFGVLPLTQISPILVLKLFGKPLPKSKLCTKNEVVRFNSCRGVPKFLLCSPSPAPSAILDLKVVLTAYCANRKLCTKFEVASSIITEISRRSQLLLLHSGYILLRVSTPTRDIDIGILSVYLSVCHVPVFCGNGLTYCYSFFTTCSLARSF